MFSSNQPSFEAANSAAASAWERLQSKATEAWFKYTREQRAAQMEAQRNLEEVQRGCTAALVSLSEEMQNRFREICNSYYQRLQEISSQPDFPTQVVDMNRDFVNQIQKLQEETLRRLDEKWRHFGNDITEAQRLSQTSLKDAYRNYLRAQQEAWANLDITALVS